MRLAGLGGKWAGKSHSSESSSSSSVALLAVVGNSIAVGTMGASLIIGMPVAFVRFGRGVVLRMPCRGRFICPFAVAGLGFKYFRIRVSDKLGHPFRKPRRTAFSRVDILGFPNA